MSRTAPQTGPDYQVNSGGSTSDGMCGITHCSLAEAVMAANNDGVASTIEFSTPISEEIRGHGLRIFSPITINAAGHAIDVDLSTTLDDRLFHVLPNGSLTINQAKIHGRDGLLLGPLDIDAGGVILNEGTLNIDASTIFDNQDIAQGGAIFNGGTARITNSTFYNNQADIYGGAIYNTGTATIANSTFTSNAAGATFPSGGILGSGGAIYNTGTLTILSSTMIGNKAMSGTGSANIFNAGTATVINTILFSQNVYSYSNNPCGGTALAAGMNNLSVGTSCSGVTVTATATDINTFGALQNNGGLTPTIALLANNKAIEKGNVSACTSGLLLDVDTGLWRDQRGYKRFIDGTDADSIAQCDIGAFEYNSVPGSNAPADDENPPMAWIELIPATPDGAKGWYKSPVTLTPNAFDDVDVIDLRCALDPAVPPVSYAELPEAYCDFLDPETATVSADGSHTLYAAALDEAGNASEIVSASFQIDATVPVLTCPAAGPFLLNSGDQPVGPAGVDASVSGLDEASSTLSGIVTTGSVGLKSLTFTAFDLAGNSSSQECSYNVIYDFGGFYPPVAAAPGMNPAVSGSAIPLKFSLAGDQGLDIFSAGFPTMQPVSCSTLEPAGDPSATKPAGNSGLSYDPETGWYNYVWKTGKNLTGTCQALTLQLIDGTQHIAYFMFE